MAQKRSLTFEKDVVPILQKHCLKCHGGKSRKAGLDLRRRFTMLNGGDSGAAIVLGNVDESLLIEMIVDGSMPPEEEKRLGQGELKVLQDWVATGAPLIGKTELPLPTGEDGISAEDRQHWAFQTPRRSTVPQVKATQRVRTAIDAFLLAKLEAKGLTFNDDADRRVMLRRLCFDLHGLPPTEQQMESFLHDDRPDAYVRLVERLLASPRYGERWARHWLDVAGYAESDGYLAADRVRPEAWRYRDYVIRAYNNDKSYDRFLLEQLAGDELTDWRKAKKLTPQMADNLIATGFLRTAADPTYGGYKEPLECHKVMADTMQIIGSSILGLTVQCARCHEHKNEPITQRDYYSLNAVLLASYDPQNWQVSAARVVPMASEVEQAEMAKHNQAVDGRLKKLNGQLTSLVTKYRDMHLAEELAAIDAKLQEQVKAALLIDVKKRNAAQKKLVADRAPKVKADEATVASRYPEFKTEAAKLRVSINAETARKRPVVQLRGLIDLGDKPRQAHILLRGDHNKPGAAVQPNVPVVLSRKGAPYKVQPGYKTTGRRKAFAQWLVDPQHPLTARVRVNRIWAHHFGRGLVPTLSNFGRSGLAPSHRELLDWLASEFAKQGWSEKQLHRLLVTSTAYRQSSDYSEKKAAVDPQNILLWSFNPLRHEGEVVRDSVLALAGKLNLQMEGPGVPVARRGDGEVVVADHPQNNRRSIYLFVRRSQHVTVLDLFDTPMMEINCTQRNQSIVVTQALTLMNSSFTESNAAALATRICNASADRTARIDAAYRWLFTREPRDKERPWITTFLEDFARDQLGEKFDTATDAQRRAAYRAGWKHVAQVLLNSNEFIYVH